MDNANQAFDKERFDAYLALADFSSKRVQERVSREMRMSFAVWAFLVAATFYVHARPSETFLSIMLTTVVILHAGFIMDIRARNDWDTRMLAYCMIAARAFVTDAPGPGALGQWVGRPTDSQSRLLGPFVRDFWWSGLEITVTVLLAVTAYLLMGGLAPTV